MNLPRGIRRAFRLLVPGSHRDETDEELALHLERCTEELVARGLDPEAAQREALRRFGDLDRVRAECRRIDEARERRWRLRQLLGELRQDLALGVRQLRSAPAFAALAILTLALGVGATATIFGAVHAVVLQPLPFPHPERIVRVWETRRGEARPTLSRGDVSTGNFTELAREARSFESLAISQGTSVNLAAGAVPERVRGARVSAGWFEVFGLRAELGRTFGPEEDRPGGDDVVVLSHRLWSTRFGADPAIVGRSIRMNGHPHTVVGVMPAAFDRAGDPHALWVPIALTAAQRHLYDEHMYQVVGRLAPGVSLAQAQSEADAAARHLREIAPDDDRGRGFELHPYARDLVGSYRFRLLLLLGAVGLVLLIASVNVANLLLARGTSRGREMAVRASLGARRVRLVRQLLTEGLVLALAGGAAGLALAWGGLRLVIAFAPDDVPRLDQAGLDGAVLAVALGAGVACSLLAGLLPALRASAAELGEALGEGGRGTVGCRRAGSLRGVLVAAEVALSLVLLAGAGLLIRSALALGRVEPGFPADSLLTARITLPASAYPGDGDATRAFEELARAVEGLPGARAAGVASAIPMGGSGPSNGLLPEGRPLDRSEMIDTDLRLVSPGYFRALGLPLLQGRTFTARDDRRAPGVMVVNRTFAEEAWPGEDPVGKRVACCVDEDDPNLWKQVVGVVGDTRADGLGRPAPPEFYLPLDQAPPRVWVWLRRSMYVAVRAAPGRADARGLANDLRRAVRGFDPDLPVYDVATMDQRLAGSLARNRFQTLLLAGLGGIGLLLAVAGIYGVVAYFVSRRTREIGVRIALGASAGRVLGMALAQALRPVALGLVAGVAGALAATRLLAGFLYGVAPGDPATLAATALGLGLVGALAGYLPARRALAIDPREALAGE